MRAKFLQLGMDGPAGCVRSEEHTSELQSRRDLVCRLLREKKKHRRVAGPRTAHHPRRGAGAPSRVARPRLVAGQRWARPDSSRGSFLFFAMLARTATVSTR